MKTAEPRNATPASSPPSESFSRTNSPKVLPGHLEKLAIVYVRQSSPTQVLEHRESTARQYGFAEQAVAFGWPRERVLIIDEDLGKSGRTAEGRSGFQRLITEVTLNHVGMVLGLEMSRLARSSKDWHAFFEMCAVFGTLIADADGVYDGNDPNDRLLLGLKGIMSEMELHIMRNRLERGRDNKAQRGELFFSVPVGYVILPTGEVDFDPDEQAQEVIRLIFDKFDELGTIYGVFHWLIRNDIKLPIRPRAGAKKGQLDWRRPSISYFGECAGSSDLRGGVRLWSSVGRSETQVVSHEVSTAGADGAVESAPQRPAARVHHLGALSAKPRADQAKQESIRLPGCASLWCHAAFGVAGLWPLRPADADSLSRPRQGPVCTATSENSRDSDLRCPGLAARAVDDLVAQQVLRALEPAAVELSLRAQADVEQERMRLEKHWQQRRQRARYDTELAERRYQAVDPENRLVAGTLEKRWEQLLVEEKQLQEDYDRFRSETPIRLSPEERKRITALTSDIPALWKEPGTTNVDRKQIVRCLVERVTVQVDSGSELTGVTIHWAGGYESQHEIVRPVRRYEQLRDLEPLLDRAQELRANGQTISQIAEQLNREGFHTPTGRGRIKAPMVIKLLERRGVIPDERANKGLLGDHEWWLSDLADELQTTRSKLQEWALRGWVQGRKTPVQGCWVLWADKDELRRLRALIKKSKPGKNRHASDLKRPKKRPK